MARPSRRDTTTGQGAVPPSTVQGGQSGHAGPAGHEAADHQAAGHEVALDPELIRLAVVVILGAIMSILDTTIVNVAIDTLARDFHSPLSTIQWVSTGYLLALSIVIPLSGWAVERFGAKPMWILSLSVFLIGSILSGAAWSAQSLIVFRILQGIGGGMIMPIGTSILAEAAGPQRIGRVMSVLGVPMLLAPILGPVLGGLLVTSASWRWIFYLNVPIGAVAIFMAVRRLPSLSGGLKPRLDTFGFLLLSPGLASLVYGLSELGSSGSTAQVVIPVVIGVLLIAAFARHASRRVPVRQGSARPAALIDVRLFADRSFLPAALTSFGFGAALFGALILLPLYYQVDRGESALVAGLLIAPQGLGAALVMPLAGRLSDRFGPGRVVPFGLIVVIVGTLAYTVVGASTSYTFLAFALFVRGIGFGFTMMPAMAAAYHRLERSQVPRATTSINILQRVGGSIGTALLAVILERQIDSRFPGAANAITSGTSLSATARQHIAGPIAAAFGHTFWWAVGMAAVAFVPSIFLSRRSAADLAPPAETGLGLETADGTGGDHRPREAPVAPREAPVSVEPTDPGMPSLPPALPREPVGASADFSAGPSPETSYETSYEHLEDSAAGAAYLGDPTDGGVPQQKPPRRHRAPRHSPAGTSSPPLES
jgi:EmrB/QacA subfamily drug resistance transporter